LQQFLEFKRKKQGEKQMQAYEEVMDGIRIYFNRALGTILLYRSVTASNDTTPPPDCVI
jgi:hypothetical protein